MTEQVKGYPVILGGDHAEFERQHANTPPKERPDWPLPSFDARDWAVAFCKIAKTDGLEIDEAWMQTWFSNALMRGFDEQTGRVAAEIARLRAERDQLLAALKPMVDAWDMSGDEGQHRRIWDTARAALAAVEDRHD